MPDALQALLAAGLTPSDALPPSSRYRDVGIARYQPPAVDPAGDDDPTPVPYYRRRLCPQPDSLTTIGVHTVADGERPDTVAGTELGDPALWWRVADANAAIDPVELTAEPGAPLRITLPSSMVNRG